MIAIVIGRLLYEKGVHAQAAVSFLPSHFNNKIPIQLKDLGSLLVKAK